MHRPHAVLNHVLLRRLATVRAVLLLILLPLGTTSCGALGSCTEAGCITGLTLEFASPLQDGDHVLEISTPEGETVCTKTVQWLGTGSYMADGSCEGDLDVISTATALTVRGTPAEATVRLASGGEHVGTAWVSAVDYETHYPNGSSCPPVCEIASQEIEFVVK